MHILVIDCSSLMWKSKHMLNDILSYGDMQTGIVFGFFWSMFKLSRKFETSKFVFCLDSDKRKSVRKAIFPDYKKKTKEEELDDIQISLEEAAYEQFKRLPGILGKMGFSHIFQQEGYEADDIIASVCMNATEQQKKEIIIVSGDKDLYQLMSHCKGMFFRRKEVDTLYTQEDLMEEWGCTPEEWALVKAYGGCASDKVPGLPGFGPTTAVKFIRTSPMKGKKAQMFYSAEGKEIINRNTRLVKLPFDGTSVFRVGTKDNLKYDEFMGFCMEYSINTFLDNPKNKQFWKELFTVGGFK